ncbi:MAG: DUF4355 domain-containing protein [Clostridiales bacterium]|nr:DUF4355 domain-containing protein [Clostridiales bacterium]
MEEKNIREAEKQENHELDDLLRENVALQSQFDKKISQALNKARLGWEKEHGDAELLVRKAEERAAEQERSMRERELAVEMRERREAARISLSGRGLPGGLECCLNYTDGESLDRSMDELEKAFKEEVKKAVELKLQGTPPKSGEGRSYMSQMRAALGLK